VRPWLRSLSFRLPGADVILVGTKCDVNEGPPPNAAQRIEGACRKWLDQWYHPTSTKRSGSPLCIEDGVSLISCGGDSEGKESQWPCDWPQDSGGGDSSSLLHRVVHKNDGTLRSVRMVLPLSWGL
ncbi:unnamed protein product, partial [Discosporangium mesarthrocarpum]